MIIRRIVVTAAAAVAINGLALAEMQSADQGTATPGSAGQMGSSQSQMGGQSSAMQQMTPEQFIKQAAAGSEFEIQSAKLAESKSNDPMVKQTASEILKDHQKAQDELKKVADKNNWTVSQQLDPQHQQMLDDLKSKSGDQFTQTFDQQQIQAHQEAISLYQSASSQVQNQDLKDYINKTLPRLQQHLAMLKQDQQKAAQGGAMPGGAQPAGSALPGSQDQQQQQSPQQQQPQQGGLKDQNRTGQPDNTNMQR